MRRKAKVTMPSAWLWVIIGSIAVLLMVLALLLFLGEGRSNSKAVDAGWLSKWAAPGQRYESTSTHEQRFVASSSALVELDADVGSVVIRGTEAREVHAVAKVVAWGSSVEESEEALRETSFAMEQRDDDTVHLQSSLLRRIAGVRTPRIAWDVSVPSGSALVVQCSVGDVTITDCAGDLVLTSGVGNVVLENVNAGNDVLVDANIGSITVIVPRDASLALSAQTMSGKIRSKLDIDQADIPGVSQGSLLVGQLGSALGGGTMGIMLQTGDIELRYAK